MTREEVKQMCAEMGLYFDKEHPEYITLSKLKSLSPPFMEFYLEDRPVWADARRYLDIKKLTIRVYSDLEVSEKEKDVQAVLDKKDIRWRRSTKFSEELLLWTIDYTMEV